MVNIASSPTITMHDGRVGVGPLSGSVPIDADRFLYNWIPAQHSSLQGVKWIEEDWGGTIGLKMVIMEGVEFTFSYKDVDDDMGSQGVNYTDTINYCSLLYNTGYLKWVHK